MAKNKKKVLKNSVFSFNVPKIDTGAIYYGDIGIGLNTKNYILITPSISHPYFKPQLFDKDWTPNLNEPPEKNTKTLNWN